MLVGLLEAWSRRRSSEEATKQNQKKQQPLIDGITLICFHSIQTPKSLLPSPEGSQHLRLGPRPMHVDDAEKAATGGFGDRRAMARASWLPPHRGATWPQSRLWIRMPQGRVESGRGLDCRPRAGPGSFALDRRPFSLLRAWHRTSDAIKDPKPPSPSSAASGSHFGALTPSAFHPITTIQATPRAPWRACPTGKGSAGGSVGRRHQQQPTTA